MCWRRSILLLLCGMFLACGDSPSSALDEPGAEEGQNVRPFLNLEGVSSQRTPYVEDAIESERSPDDAFPLVDGNLSESDVLSGEEDTTGLEDDVNIPIFLPGVERIRGPAEHGGLASGAETEGTNLIVRTRRGDT